MPALEKWTDRPVTLAQGDLVRFLNIAFGAGFVLALAVLKLL